MVLDRNTSPYYNDFDVDKKYVEILFRPGLAVQARELTQMQTTIQNQIDRFGKHIFKEGSQVIPGEIGIDKSLPYVTLADQFSATDIDVANFVGKKVYGTTSGTVAYVLDGINDILDDPNTLFLKYETGASSTAFTGDLTSGSFNVLNVSATAGEVLKVGSIITGTGIPSNTFVRTITDDDEIVLSNAATSTASTVALTQTTGAAFTDGEVLETEDGLYFATVESDSALPATGFGSRVQIKQGVYFALGYFCLVDDQTLILDNYSNTPSYKIGLRVIDSFVTDADDISLVDPAQGSPNSKAPGAHRYKLELILSKFALDATTPENFIELLRVDSGAIQTLVNTPQYSELEKTLARRTNDESGSYTVRNFPVQIKEHLDDGTNYGAFSASDGGDETKVAVSLEPGKAFVQGFEIETATSLALEADKARSTTSKNNAIIPFQLGNYIFVDNLLDVFNISAYEAVNLLDATTGGDVIGTAKVRGLEFVSGTPGTDAIYKLFLFDVKMELDSNSDAFLFSAIRKAANAGATVDAEVILDGGLAVLYNSGIENNAFLKLPDSAVSSVTDVNYTVKRFHTGTLTGTSITLSGASNEIFSGSSLANYTVTVTTASGTAIGNGIADGDIINMAAGGNSIVLGGSPTGRQVTLTLGDASGSTVSIISTVSKSAEVQKTKTLTNTDETIAHATLIQLTKADVYVINSILDGATDITDRYTFDTGQRDNFYDRASLTFDTSYAAPSGNVTVDYDYFDHGAGDYFSVDSYSGVIDYEDIQTFVSPSNGGSFDLRNVIDFRPRVNDAGTGFSVVSEIVANTENFTGDYDFYIPRIDKITVDSKGSFAIVAGVPAQSPYRPATPAGVMVLYELEYPAYTFKTSDIIIVKTDNKRYTMNDIGRLEKRIEAIEYYSSLNLLEKDTADLFIDDGTGANRFKSGFLVDNFTSHLVGNAALSEYRCAIDKEHGLLRPAFASNSVPMELDVGNSSNYQKTGDLLTLPYTVESFIYQPAASSTENINPYAVFNWVGSITLNPSSDEWYETTQAPDRIITNDDGLADSLAAVVANSQVIWNDWETDWIGTPISSTQISSVRQANLVVPGQGTRRVFEVTSLVSAEQGQSRSGVQLNVQETTNTETLGDRVIGTTTIPWIREKDVAFSCAALKPNTQVYPFFDDVNVSAFTKPTGGSLGDALVSNSAGEIGGTFEIPNTDNIRFRTGERIFKLVDSDTNDVNFTTTAAESPYTAKGILETKEETIISTRSAKIVTTDVTDSRVIIGTNIQTETRLAGWIDPLAQTFLVESAGGVFLSKLDIFFSTKDTSGIPVTLQIRNVVNGYPGQFILPFSEVVLSPDDITTSTDSTVASSFTFDSPVYLQDGQEYCFVLLANSIDYNVWVSTIGEFDVATGERISEQPYAGVMFKSQNASTWTADQERDIKFDIHRCVFDTGVAGSVLFKNGDLIASNLLSNPVTTIDTSTDVIIALANHGLQDGEQTTLAGFDTDVNGVPFAELNGTHTITYVDFDSFQITVTTAADETGTGGGSQSATALANIRADVINPLFEAVALPNTGIGWAARVRDASNILHGTYIPIEVKSNVEFTDERFVFNTDNEAATRSLHVQATMVSVSDTVSPVIDTQRSSVITVTNRINNDSTNELQAESGNALARYITSKISLATPAISSRVYFSAVRSPVADIKVYIKYLKDAESGEIFDDLPYEELAQVEYPLGAETEFRDYVFELENLEPYSTYAMKIVSVSEETSDVPLIKDFRTIALGT